MTPGAGALKDLARRFGVELRRYSVQHSPDAQLGRLLGWLGADLVLDVGANEGQYARSLRRIGYRGRIVSFEPLSGAHRRLARAARGAGGWIVAPRMALGEAEGEVTLHVAGNSVSSSILDMLPEHERAAPGSAYVASETVRLARLDHAAAAHLEAARATLLKIDAQGYEDHVLAGAAGILDRIRAIQTELSLVPLYAGQPLFEDMVRRLDSLGFVLHALFPGHVDEETGRTVQVDGFFARRDLTPGRASP